MAEVVGVPIRTAGIRLGQFLKLADAVDQGSDAREVLASGSVRVNGEVESRRGRQLSIGDVVTVPPRAYRVEATTTPRA
jgi:ribosome-associated protein